MIFEVKTSLRKYVSGGRALLFLLTALPLAQTEISGFVFIFSVPNAMLLPVIKRKTSENNIRVYLL